MGRCVEILGTKAAGPDGVREGRVIPFPHRTRARGGEVDVLHDGPATAIVLRGELDVAFAADLDRALRSAVAGPGATLDLDLTGLAFCDSSVLSWVLRAHRRSEALGTVVRVRAREGAVLRLLRLTLLDRSLPLDIVEDEPSTASAGTPEDTSGTCPEAFRGAPR